MNILAIIPARSGSKELPGKNIKPINGKPLIVYTIQAANKSRYINRIIVSTDDGQIAQIARSYKAKTPFMRPKSLAADTTPMSDVIIHALQALELNESYKPDLFVLLQPTCPLRTSQHIDEAIQLLSIHNCDAVISVSEVDDHPYLMKRIQNNQLIDFATNPKEYSRRQELPPVYKLNGCIYVCKTDPFLKQKQIHLPFTIPYIMKKEVSLDIDTILDFKLAEFLLQLKGGYDID